MATNFPGSADSFTNPTSGSSLSSPSHADQHTNVNDAVEAIETALLDGAPLKIDDANNRVGIGTTSPDTKLHVQIGTSAAPSSVPTSHMIIADSGEGTDSGMAVYSSTTGNGYFRFGDSDSAAQGGFRYEHSADKMYFRTGGTDRGAIDSSGRVTMPYQPSFRAYLNVSPNPTYGSGWSVMSWNTTDFNVGGHYNTTNYRFTAPVAGKYLFTTSVNFYNIAQGDRFIVEFLKSNAYSYRLTDIDSYNAIGDDRNLGGSIIMNLSANDYVQVRAYGATANWRRSAGYNYAHFAGHFLG